MPPKRLGTTAISATKAIVPTSTRSFLRANFFFLAIKLPTLIPFTSVFFSSLYVRKHTRASHMYCNMYLVTNRTLLTVPIKCAFVSLNTPYSPERLMYENKRVRRRLLILRLVVRCALWSKKYGSLEGSVAGVYGYKSR